MYGYGLGYYYRAKHMDSGDQPACMVCGGSGADTTAEGLTLPCVECNGTGRPKQPPISTWQGFVIAGVLAFYLVVMIAIYLHGNI